MGAPAGQFAANPIRHEKVGFTMERGILGIRSMEHYEAAVVGAGPAGLACALGMARAGIKTILFAGPHRPGGFKVDQRTAALFGCSIDFLTNLGAFEYFQGASAPIRGIRIIDDTGRLLRAPEVLFTAQDIGFKELGYNVPQHDLVEALRRHCKAYEEHLRLVETKGVVDLAHEDEVAVLKTGEGGTFSAKVIAAADGRNSKCAQMAGLGVKRQSLDQTALATTFSHQRDHHAISTEFHRHSGPCTVVPMPGRRSSLVWVERTDVARRLCEMPLDKFAKTLETRLQGLLGDVSSIGPRTMFPLVSQVATRMGQRRVALIGEAGHVIPPIGAQGLNLSLRDAGMLVDLVSDAKTFAEDPGGDKVLNAYHKARWFDIHSRVNAVELLNRSLISDFEPVQLMRTAGLHVLKSFGPLRRFVIREGLGPQTGLPRMMQKQRPSQQTCA